MVDDGDIEGERLGRYTLQRRLGKGGMGEVFLARSSGAHGFEKLVAIKRILPQYSASTQVVNMLVDEARISVRLNHPNVVQVLELDEDAGSHYIVMEYVDGHALSRLVRRVRKRNERLDPLIACGILMGVLDGLHAAHTHKDDDGTPAHIIHRDVSPQNVLLSMGGQVKVIDFGIARARDRLEATQGSQVKGKLRYMAPEQIKPSLAGSSGIDHRIDVFAAGVVLFEMLAMRARYPQEGDLQVIDAILEEPTPDLHAEGLVDAELMKVVATATHKDRRKRYKDAASFAAALRGYVYARDPSFSAERIAQLMRRCFSDADDDAGAAPEPRSAARARAERAERGERGARRGRSDAPVAVDDDVDHAAEPTRTTLRAVPPSPSPSPAPGTAVVRRPRRIPPAAIGAVIGVVVVVACALVVRAAMKPRQLPVDGAASAGVTTASPSRAPASLASTSATATMSPATPLPATATPPTSTSAVVAAVAPSPANAGGLLDLGGGVEFVVEVTPATARIAPAYQPGTQYVSPARLKVQRGETIDLLFEAEGYEPLRRQFVVDASTPRASVVLTPVPMPLVIRPVPRDAELTVNGKPWKTGGTVAPDQDLVITASHPFYVEQTVTVRSKPGESLVVDLTLTERTKDELVEEKAEQAGGADAAARGVGVLVLRSRPAGADVFVDGKRLAAKTPVREELKAGTHKITVRTRGAEQTFSVELAAGAVTARDVTLE